MEIFVYNYKRDKKFATISGEFDYLMVEVISGDEHVYAYKNGGTGKHPICVGSVWADRASYTEYEGMYFVDRDEFDEWTRRGDSCFWLYEKPYRDMETSE